MCPFSMFCVSQPTSHGSACKPLRFNLTILSISVLIIVVGIYLEPDARGYGTHQSIGLPACPVPQLTGCPCPTCGFTTSLAQMTRGHFVAAFRSHVLGALVFLGAVSFLFWIFTASLFRTSPFAAYRLLKSKWFWCVVIFLFYLSWFVNIGAVALKLKLYN